MNTTEKIRKQAFAEMLEYAIARIIAMDTQTDTKKPTQKEKAHDIDGLAGMFFETFCHLEISPKSKDYWCSPEYKPDLIKNIDGKRHYIEIKSNGGNCKYLTDSANKTDITIYAMFMNNSLTNYQDRIIEPKMISNDFMYDICETKDKGKALKLQPSNKNFRASLEAEPNLFNKPVSSHFINLLNGRTLYANSEIGATELIEIYKNTLNALY